MADSKLTSSDILKLYSDADAATSNGATVAPAVAPADGSAPPSSADILKAYSDADAAAAAQTPPTITGLGNSFLRGVHQATDVPAHALASGADYLANKLGYQTHFAQDADDAARPFNQAYDADPANQTLAPTIARVAGNAAITIPGAIGAGSLARAGMVGASQVVPAATNVLRFATPVVSGATEGATVAGLQGDPVGPSAALGGGIGAAGGMIGGLANKLIGPASPEVTTAMETYGIPLRAGQTSDNRFVNKLDQMVGQLPFSGRAAENEAQRVATNNAIGKTFGEDVPKITPPVMQAARDRIGGVMNDVENTNPVKIGDQAMTRLADIESNAHASMEDGEFGVIKRQLDNIMSKVGTGDTIAGTTYGDMIGHGSPLDAALNNRNSNIANYAGQIKSVLQDSLADSLSPSDAARYAEARLQYKNMMTVAPLVNKGTPGDISPLLLQGAANRSFKGNAFRGAGDLGELADLAQTYLRPPADSGTPLGTAILNGLARPLAAGANILTGTAGGRIASMVTGANPLTGVQGPTTLLGKTLLRSALPASVLFQNNMLNPR